MPEIPPILDHRVTFDPTADFEAFLQDVPAKWVIYLLGDEQDRPLQLLCVKNLRASLRRRLGSDEQIGPSRRVNYREVVRNIHFRRVDSGFEADWLYYEIARELFPQTYQGMIGFRPAWFVHVNPATAFPRYIKTTDLSRPGEYIGPLEDKHAAARLIELAQDLFDLCRYYNILVEAPNGKACAYKEMGKCPAPCDGSISIQQYHRLIEWSLRTLVDPADAIRTHRGRMQQAAVELRFETAAKIKAYVEQLSQLGKGAFRHARRLADFLFVSLQHGPRQGNAKLFLITPGTIQHIACVIDDSSRTSELLGCILRAASQHSQGSLDAIGAERIGIVSHHLFSPKQKHGVFLRLEDVTEPSLARSLSELGKRPVEPESEAEGVLKELQSL
jgi:excinuclease UvrABC nuclease subunit